MNAASWITQTVEEFGRTLGIDELTFDERGVLQLEIEDRGVLALELRESDVLVYLARVPARLDRDTFRQALQLCHHSESDRSWVQAALLSEGRLAFAVRVLNSDFHLAALEEAITALTNLHDLLAEGCAT